METLTQAAWRSFVIFLCRNGRVTQEKVLPDSREPQLGPLPAEGHGLCGLVLVQPSHLNLGDVVNTHGCGQPRLGPFLGLAI